MARPIAYLQLAQTPSRTGGLNAGHQHPQQPRPPAGVHRGNAAERDRLRRQLDQAPRDRGSELGRATTHRQQAEQALAAHRPPAHRDASLVAPRPRPAQSHTGGLVVRPPSNSTGPHDWEREWHQTCWEPLDECAVRSGILAGSVRPFPRAGAGRLMLVRWADVTRGRGNQAIWSRTTATASCWVSWARAANAWSKRSAPSAWRTWSTSSASPCRSSINARRPTRRRRPSAAPASSAARSPSPLDERQLGERGQAQGHVAGAVGPPGSALAPRPAAPGPPQPASHHRQGAQQHPGPGGQPGVVEPLP